MRIKQISVTDLFGLFDHTIPLNVEERITIIHGPNGFGKTVLLEMIYGFFHNNFTIFRRVPFSTFRIDFDTGEYVVIRQEKMSKRTRNKIIIEAPGKDSFTIPTITRKDLDFPVSVIESAIPELELVGAEEWLNRETNATLSLDAVLEQFGERLPGSARITFPGWLLKIQSKIHTHLIQANRLLMQAPSPYGRLRYRYERERMMSSVPTVTQYSRELAKRIQQTLAQSAELSQSLDRTFPIRLVKELEKGGGGDISSEHLRERLKKLEEKRTKLMNAGLMGKDDANVDIPDRTDMGDSVAQMVLSIYADDVEKKLQVFDEILEKISLLQKIINSRFSYSLKYLSIDKEKGFVIETSDGASLSPNSLSSGEQHELILFYDLLFHVKPNSLILIDEPEISLHIAWQQEFLKDLQDVTSLTNIDVLIATHSADIILDKWDLTVELQGPQNEAETL